MTILRLSPHPPDKPVYSLRTKTKFGIIPSHPEKKLHAKKMIEIVRAV